MRSGDVSGQSSLVNGNRFNLAAPDTNSVVFGDSTATLPPAGCFDSLHNPGTGRYGSQTARTIAVEYNDDFVGTFTLSFSDCFFPQLLLREAVAVQMAYREFASILVWQFL